MLVGEEDISWAVTGKHSRPVRLFDANDNEQRTLSSCSVVSVHTSACFRSAL